MTRTRILPQSAQIISSGLPFSHLISALLNYFALCRRLSHGVAIFGAASAIFAWCIKHLPAYAKLCQAGLCFCLILACHILAHAQEISSAKDLLQRAADAQGNQPLTQLFRLEKKARGNAEAVAFTLETKRSPTAQSFSVRLYSAENLLLAGDWATPQQRKIYQREATPEVVTESAATDAIWFNWQQLWLVKPTLAALTALLSSDTQTVVEETREAYWLTCRFADAGQIHGLVKARWGVRREDWQLSEVLLIVEGNEEILEYKLTALPAAPKPPLEEPPLLASLDAETFAPPSVPPVTSAVSAENHGNGSMATPVVTTAPTPAPDAMPPPATPPLAPVQSPNSLKVLSIGSGLSEKAVQQQTPVYPPIARSYRTGGTVTVYLELDEQGGIAKVTRLEGPFLLQSAARTAALGWRFKPTLIDGQPVRVTGHLVFHFKP